MSYILEALKKSEMERRAGSITGLSPGATYVMTSDGGFRHTGVAMLAAAGLLGAGLALGIWHPWKAPAAPQPIPAAALPPPSPGASPAEAPPALPVPIKTEGPATAPVPVRSGAVDAVRSAAATAKTAPRSAVPAEAGRRVIDYRNLPAGIRSKLPQFTFGGYAGTDEAESRIAFINNRLVKEGEEVSPGVRLEEAGQAGVVLGFRGYRFRPAP